MGVRGELHLRLASLAATTCGYSGQLLKWSQVNPVVIAMQTGLLFRAAKLTWRVYRSSRALSFTPRELELFEAHFAQHGLSRQEFHELLRAGAEWKSDDGDVGRELTQEGEPVANFVLLTAGRCVVTKGGEPILTIGAGELIGEQSFARRVDHASTGPNATATVAADGPIEYVAWSCRGLAQHVERSSHVKACLMTLIAAAQADKLEKTSRVAEVSLRKLSSSSHDFDAHPHPYGYARSPPAEDDDEEEYSI